MNIPAAVGTLRVSDSARAAVRSGAPGENDELGFDNLLRLDASLAWPTTELFVGYGPRLGVARDIEGMNDAWDLTFLHDLEAGLTFNQPRYTLSFRQGFTFGTQSFGEVFATPEDAAVGAPGATPDLGTPTNPDMTPAATDVPTGAGAPVPLDSSIPVWSASSRASLVYLYSQRWQSTYETGFGTSGGNGAAAELTLPRLQTVDASANLIHDLTPRHQVGAELQAEHGWTRASDYWYSTLAGLWTVLFSRETELALSAGAGFRDTQDPLPLPPLLPTRSQAIVPVGSASLTHEVGMRGSRARYALSVAYAPTVDTLRARLQDRLTASASAGLASTSNSATLSVSGSQSFPTDAVDAARFIGISLALTHQFTDAIGIELGGQIADQSLGGADALAPVVVADPNDGTVWTVYVGLGAQLDPIRF